MMCSLSCFIFLLYSNIHTPTPVGALWSWTSSFDRTSRLVRPSLLGTTPLLHCSMSWVISRGQTRSTTGGMGGVCLPRVPLIHPLPQYGNERKGRKENYFSSYCHRSAGLFDPQGRLPPPTGTCSVDEELAGHILSHSIRSKLGCDEILSEWSGRPSRLDHTKVQELDVRGDDLTVAAMAGRARSSSTTPTACRDAPEESLDKVCQEKERSGVTLQKCPPPLKTPK